MAQQKDIPVVKLPSEVGEDAEPYNTITDEHPEGHLCQIPEPEKATGDRSSPTLAASVGGADSVFHDFLKQGHPNLRKSLQTIIGKDQSPLISTQLVCNEQNNGKVYEIDIPEDEYPAKFKAEYYDIFILAHEDDRSQVYEFKNMLQTESQLILKCGGNIKVLTSFDDVGMGLGEFTAVEYAMKYCTYVFLYITKSFCEDDNAKLHGDACLMKTVESRNNKWCVVPIHTRLKKHRDYELPYGINVLKGIAACRDNFFYSNIKRLIEDKLSIRLRREKLLLADREKWRQKEMDKERSNRQNTPEPEKVVTATVTAPASQSSWVPQMLPSGSHPQDINILKSQASIIHDSGECEISETPDKPLVMQETIASGTNENSIVNDIEVDAYDSKYSGENSDRTVIDESSNKFTHSLGEQTNRQISLEPVPSARSKYPDSTSQTNFKSSPFNFVSQSDEPVRDNMRQRSNEYSPDDRSTVVKEIHHHHHHYSQPEPKEQSSAPGVVYNITGASSVQIGANNMSSVGPPAPQPVDKTDRSAPTEAPSPGKKSPDGFSTFPDPKSAHQNRFSKSSPSFPGEEDISLPPNSFNQRGASALSTPSQPSEDVGTIMSRVPVAIISPFEMDDQTVAKTTLAGPMIRENPDGMENQDESSEGHQNPEESRNTVPKVIDSPEVTESSQDDTSEQTREKECYGHVIDSCSEADEDLNGEAHLRRRSEAQQNVTQQQSEHLESEDDLQTESAKRVKHKTCTIGSLSIDYLENLHNFAPTWSISHVTQ